MGPAWLEKSDEDKIQPTQGRFKNSFKELLGEIAFGSPTPFTLMWRNMEVPKLRPPRSSFKNSWGRSPLGALLPSLWCEEIWRFPNCVLQGHYEIGLGSALKSYSTNLVFMCARWCLLYFLFASGVALNFEFSIICYTFETYNGSLKQRCKQIGRVLLFVFFKHHPRKDVWLPSAIWFKLEISTVVVIIVNQRWPAFPNVNISPLLSSLFFASLILSFFLGFSLFWGQFAVLVLGLCYCWCWAWALICLELFFGQWLFTPIWGLFVVVVVVVDVVVVFV